MSTIPVSYTHLDVYKRQAVYYAYGDIVDTPAAGSLFSNSHAIVGNDVCKDLEELANDDDVKAVSYTHLDVYKRQVEHCAIEVYNTCPDISIASMLKVSLWQCQDTIALLNKTCVASKSTAINGASISCSCNLIALC